MKPERFFSPSIIISAIALIVSVGSVIFSVYQFDIQNRSDLKANCAFNRDSQSSLSPLFTPYEAYSKDDRYELKVQTRCILLNDGRKDMSILKVRSVLTGDGKPMGQAIEPIALYQNDLVRESDLPMLLLAGESKQIDVWTNIDVGSLTERAVRQCSKGNKTYSDYDVCFHGNGFSIANHVYVEPYVQYFPGGTYNGVGIQFFTGENMEATFEIDVLRNSIISTGGKLAKNYDEETFDNRYRNPDKVYEGIFLERGYRTVYSSQELGD